MNKKHQKLYTEQQLEELKESIIEYSKTNNKIRKEMKPSILRVLLNHRKLLSEKLSKLVGHRLTMGI